jgi:hypothetical protein
VPFERRISAVNQFGTGKPDTSNLIFDVIQRMVSRFRQACINGPQVRPLIKVESILFFQWRD